MLKELTGSEQNGGHQAYIQGFDFLSVKSPQDARKVIRTDDLVLSYGFDGQVILWALG